MAALSFTAQAQVVAYTHVNVIDVTDGSVLKDATIVTRGPVIEQVGRDVEPPPDAYRVNAPGLYVIPGLWDMHVHLLNPPAAFRTLIANGITGVREMYSGYAPVEYSAWRQLPDSVRMVVAGLIDGPGRRLTPGALVARNAEEGRLAVQLLVANRAEFIKVYSNLSREAYFAVADEARRIGIGFAGHVPESVTPAEAAEAGQLSQEHLLNILFSCSTREQELRAERQEFLGDPSVSLADKTRGFAWPTEAGLLDTYDPQKCAALFENFLDHRVWQTPTLAISYYAAETPLDHPPDRPMMLRRELEGEAVEEFREHARRMLDRYEQLVGDMHRAGVPLLAGTDAGPATDVPLGESLHRELELLVEAGLTPLEALRTATRNPALYFGVLGLLGSVEAGKAADLVLLSANPLEDIRATRGIVGVAVRGKLYMRDQLESWAPGAIH